MIGTPPLVISHSDSGSVLREKMIGTPPLVILQGE